ncbi:hypothetical protein LPJGGPFB_00520 [Ensifer adhaerens]|uniref:Uncharacterized protein n=1 Tax=Ensifer adhaerens TaxID=106592 RepID=A0ACC5SR63_ENSAD|nr:hypothetical protein [Ensifer adhaerens]MBP1871332.1 hypothetical protein [Ensifer adhaerens]NRP17302.1 hypothetical protein [Ensifer adhaerens]
MRFVLRLASFVVLLGAVLAGAVDAIQSVAASELVTTSLGDDLEVLGADTASWVQFAQRTDTGPTFWHSMLHWLLTQPAFAVLALLALLLWMAGYKKRPAAGRFAA